MPNPNYPAAILANFDGDTLRAYDHLARQYLALERQFADSSSSRFVEVSRFEADGEICVRKITEDQISRDTDMADCIDPGVMRNWYYVDDSGAFQPVTIGPQSRIASEEELPFRFAISDIVANGSVVGQVTYTDH